MGKRTEELMCAILRVDIEEYETEPYIQYKRETRKKFLMCRINGIKYIRAIDVIYHFSARLKSMYEKGLLTESDIIHLRTERLNTFVRLRALLDHDKEFYRMVTWDSESFYLILAKAASADPKDNIVSEAAITRSENAYKERRGILGDERREKAETRTMERVEKQHTPALEDLVRQIEGMGWKVTLTLKENG